MQPQFILSVHYTVYKHRKLSMFYIMIYYECPKKLYTFIHITFTYNPHTTEFMQRPFWSLKIYHWEGFRHIFVYKMSVGQKSGLCGNAHIEQITRNCSEPPNYSSVFIIARKFIFWFYNVAHYRMAFRGRVKYQNNFLWALLDNQL